MARGIAVILLGVIVCLSIIYLIDNQTYAQTYNGKKSYAEIHGLEPIIDKDGKKQFLILYKDRVKDKDIDELRAEGYAKIKKKFDVMPAVIASMDEKWMAKIKAKKNVVGVYEDFRVQAVLDNSIPKISADLVQNTGLLGTGVKVCIIDTGVDDSHPALSALLAEHDFVNNDNDATDDQGHGTHVAGIVGSNDSTYKGVAPGVSFMASKVLNQFGSGSFAGVLAGINWCVANGADVLNLSLGGGSYISECDPVDPNNPQNLIQQVAVAISDAYDQGIVIVAAAGNNNSPNKVLAPACASRAIAVAGTDDNDNRYAFSNRGQLLDVAAPGVAIKSTLAAVQGGDFGTKTGTSMSTPHVAGAAALLMGYDSTLTAGDVQNLLEQNAVDLGSPGFDTNFGWGRIDVWASLLAADTTAPVVTPPADITAEEATTTTPPGQAVAIGTATATDDVDLNPVITNNAPALFPLGTTIVTWTATDASGNSASADQSVTVVDTTPPVVTPPAQITEEATSSSGATVNYPPATATDDVGVTVGPDCTPISGSIFVLGDTTVTCTAQDAAGNVGSATFTVTVEDTTPPVVTPPAQITEEATSSSGATVTYPAATATDDVGVTSGPTCTPASGSIFTIGDTIVTCTASDAAGNTGSTTFTVTVQDTTPPVTTIDSVTDGNSNPVSEGETINSSSIEFQFSGTDNLSQPTNLSFECNQDSLGYLSCTSPHSITGIIDGNHMMEIRATDESENIESTATFGWNVDTVIFCDGMTITELIASGNYNLIDNRGNPSSTIIGTVNADLILGGDNGDTIEGKAGDDCIIGGAGNDSIQGGGDNDTIFGGAGIDFLRGWKGNDFIDGGTGNDFINGGNDPDTLLGGLGDDFLYGGSGNDVFNGDSGNDILWGVGGDDTITGDGGNDNIVGGGGNDSILGGLGDDIILGFSGVDIIDGEDGFDSCIDNVDPVINCETTGSGSGIPPDPDVDIFCNDMTINELLLVFPPENICSEFDFKFLLCRLPEIGSKIPKSVIL